MKKIGAFYVVSTPIGNIEDITYRAVKILKEVDEIFCENFKHSLKLLNQLDIHTSLKTLRHGENEKVLHLLQQGKDIALVSDAGTPGISDPGSSVVRFLREKDICIIPIPGVSALNTILAISGCQANPSIFLGFLSDKKGKRISELKKFEDLQGNIVLYESVHRLKSTLSLIEEIFPDSEITIGRELTKSHEEIIQTKIENLKNIKIIEKGEFVILINNRVKKVVRCL